MSARLALVIANTEYNDPGLAQLTAPGNDAEDFARVLKDPSICAFDEVNILLNEPEHVVRAKVDEFFDQKKPDDLLLLYFSGHGVRDELGALYLAVKNTNRLRLRSTALKSDFIREAMDQSRSKRQLLILDCCNSGAFGQGMKAATGVSIGTSSAFEAGAGRIILTASDSTQFAWEGDSVIGETDNSLFTHFLVKGLEGDADIDGDGNITVDELYDYAYENVRSATPKQTPSKFSSKQQGEIVLRQITRIEDIKPVSLPTELIEAAEDSRTFVREGAVQQLAKILAGKNLGLARSAREALERLEKEDDSRRVSQAAMQALEPIRELERQAEQKENEEREAKEAELLALQKEEAERKAKEESQRIAIQKAEEERLAAEQAEAERKANEAEQLAAQKAEQEHLAQIQAEIEQQEKEAAEAARRKAERKAARESTKRNLTVEAVEGANTGRVNKESAQPARQRKSKEETPAKAKTKTSPPALGPTTETVLAEAPPQSVRQQSPLLFLIGFIAVIFVITWGVIKLGSPPAATPTPPPEIASPTSEPTMAPTHSVPTEAPVPAAIDCQGSQSGDELSIVYPWTGQDEERLKQILQPLMDTCGITLTTESITDKSTLDTRVQSGTPPDIVVWYNIPSEYQNQLIKMDTLGASTSLYVPGTLEQVTINGQWLGLPVKSDIFSLVWYSPERFDAAGYGVPTTWDELDSLVEKMVADGNVPWSMGMESGDATGWVASFFIEDILLVQQGPDYVNGISNGTIPYNDAGIMQAYETYGKWATDARYTVGGADGTLSTNFMDAIYKPFSDSPEAMMVKQLPFAGNEIQNKFTASQYGTNYDFFVVPGIQGLQGSSDCMMAFSDKPEVRALVAYLSSTEGGVNWAKADFGLSPNMSAAGNYTDPALAKKAVAFYATPRFIRHIVDSMPGNFYSVEWKAIRDYLSGGDLSTVLADAAAAQAAALKQ